MEAIIPGHRIHIDAVGGIAGDMFAAALLHAMPDLLAPVQAAVSALDWARPPRIALHDAQDHSICGLRFDPGVAPPDPHGHHHVHWSAIRARLEAAALPDGVRRNAIGIFAKLAEAEGVIHGVPPDKVAFHEVGAEDSIVDILAAAALIDALSPASWSVSRLPLCRGITNSQHGVLPLPAPATARLLQGFEMLDDGEIGERVTPTGAAILSWLQPSRAAGATGRLIASGAGLGTRALRTRANMTRCLIFAPEVAADDADQVAELRLEIDDQTPEDLAIALDRLRAQDGVLDVVQWPVFGKKGRIMMAVQVLARPSAADAAAATILAETTTLGVRMSRVDRRILPRRMVDRPEGAVKVAARPGAATAKLDAAHLGQVAGAARRDALRRTAADGALAEGAEDG